MRSGNYWVTPTARERKGEWVPPAANALIAAYKIVGKNPATFYPIRIWIAKEGTFLNSETEKMLDAISAAPSLPIIKGGKGPLGRVTFDDLGEGGIYLGKVKVPSSSTAMTEPQEKQSMISVLKLGSLSLEIKVAIMAALEVRSDLIPLTGGDLYFNTFRHLETEAHEPRFDVKELFRGVNETTVSELVQTMAKTSAPTAVPKSLNPPLSSESKKPMNSFEQSESGLTANPSYWIWILICVPLFAIFLIFIKRRSSRM